MKVVILAGGRGTRLSEETVIKPKPLVEVGGRPILWHLMKIYSSHSINDFIICCGYKGYLIKEYFANYFLHMSDVTFDLQGNSMEIHQRNVEPWRVTLIDTGENTGTGGRLKRVERFVAEEEAFCLTYGDGLCDLNIVDEIKFHKEHGRDATVLAVRPPGRYGSLELIDDQVSSFVEKPLGDGGYINGGFFVLSPRVLSLITSDDSVWEDGPLQILSSSDQLRAYRHNGFWRPMDTLRDRIILDDLWNSGGAPWKVWQ